MKNILYILFIISSSFVSAQTITTIAGGGSGGGLDGLGDGGYATNATFSLLQGIILDRNNDIIVADCNNNIIRKINIATGIISVIAGTGIGGFNSDNIPATSAQLNHPSWIAIDSNGNLYISDVANERIRKIDTTGYITTFLGTGSTIYNGDSGIATGITLNGPKGICLDESGNLIVGDIGNALLRKVTPSGSTVRFAGIETPGYTGDGGPATQAELTGIMGVQSDKFGNIFVTDYSEGVIRRIDATTGIITTIAGDGSCGWIGDDIAATSSKLSFEYGLRVDNNKYIYIADQYNYRVRKIDSFGIISTIAGNGSSGYYGDGILATSASLVGPRDVAVDGCGNIFISDYNYIRKITFDFIPAIISIIAPVDSFCTGASITLNSTMTGATSGSASTFQWYVNGAAISGATNATYTYAPTGSDSVRCVLSYSSTCGAAVVSSNTINLTLVPGITPTVSLPAGIIYAAVGTVVTVNAALADTPATYTINWYNHGLWLATTTTSQLTYTKVLAVDSITAHLEGAEMCYDSAVSGVHVVIDSTLGIFSFSMVNTKFVSIYPNPAKDFLTIEAGKPMQVIAVLDMYGRVVYDKKSDRHNESIGIKELPAGLYFVQVDGVMAGKFLKE